MQKPGCVEAVALTGRKTPTLSPCDLKSGTSSMHKTGVLPAWLAVTGLIVAAATADGAELAAPGDLDLDPPGGGETGRLDRGDRDAGGHRATRFRVQRPEKVQRRRGSHRRHRERRRQHDLVVDDRDGQVIGKGLGLTSIEYCYARAGQTHRLTAAC